MRKKILLSAALIAVSFTSFAQVGVGTTSPEGALDVVSTDNGFLMPRMADEAAVTTPVEGMQVYNTTTDKVMLYDGTQWVVANTSAKWVDDPSGNGNIVLDLPTATDSTIVRSTGGLLNVSTNYINTATYYDGDSGTILPLYDPALSITDQVFDHNANFYLASEMTNSLDNDGDEVYNLTSNRIFVDALSNDSHVYADSNRITIGSGNSNDITTIQGDGTNVVHYGSGDVVYQRGAANYTVLRASSSTTEARNMYGAINASTAYKGIGRNMYGTLSRATLLEEGSSTGNMYGAFGGVIARSTGTVNAMAGVASQIRVTEGGATVNNAYGFRFITNIDATANIDNLYGLHIPDIVDGITNNYAIYTNAGKIHFGGLEEYADQTAATTAGLVAGDFYRTADGTVKVVF